MKKTLVALAALAATASFAQSAVTLYGIVDASLGTQKTTGTTTTAAGVTTITTTKGSMMRSGDLSGGRWGLRGSEDLGGGLKANFNLEHGLNVADGSVGAGFTRRSVVGLSGGFGAVDFGRDYAPTLGVTGATDVDGVNPVSTTGHQEVRRSNAITYTSNNMGGFGFKLQYANNKSSVGTTVSSPASSTVTTSDTADSKGFGANLTYANGPLYVGFGYDRATKGGMVTTSSAAAPVVAGNRETGWILGATYDLGMAKVFFNTGTEKTVSLATLAAGQAAQTAKVGQTNVGVKVPMGAVSFLAGVGRNSNKVTASGNVPTTSIKGSGTDWMLGADYSLSKRTTVYARTGVTGKLSNTVNTAGVTSRTAAKSSATYVGVRHTF